MTALMEGLHSDSTRIGSVTLHYWIGGNPDGPKIMLWHGFLATGYTWRDVASALVAAGCHVLVPDMRGYGDSDKPSGDRGYDARSLAEEGRALARTAGFADGEPIIHVAHDMGALPALIWTADHEGEVAALVYIEAPVMLGEILKPILAFTPETMREGSLWWWILPFAPDVPERLIVGNEGAFLTWFYDRHMVRRDAIDDDVLAEYLRTFSGKRGVLGSLGIYRAAFKSIAQTEPLVDRPIRTPVVAMGGRKGLGEKVGEMVRRVAHQVEAITLEDSGHFLPEERPDAVVQRVLALTRRTEGRSDRPSVSLIKWTASG
jgi:pimeloyl-ACP methyl ester carboxylesterase